MYSNILNRIHKFDLNTENQGGKCKHGMDKDCCAMCRNEVMQQVDRVRTESTLSAKV